MKSRLRRALVATSLSVAALGGSVVADVGVADAHGDHTNPCGSRQIGYNNGVAYWLYPQWGGYDYTWNQGWLIVWYQGTPFQVYWPSWEGWGC